MDNLSQTPKILKDAGTLKVLLHGTLAVCYLYLKPEHLQLQAGKLKLSELPLW